MRRRFIIVIGSHSYGGQENPQSAVCKLENQESLWCKLKSKALRTGGRDDVNPDLSPKAQEPRAPMSEGRRRWMSQPKKKVNSPLFHLFVLSGPSRSWIMPTQIGPFALFSLPIQILMSPRNTFKDIPRRASLVAQRLRICLTMQGTWVRTLVWEDPTCGGATRPVSHNYCACASGACAPQQERLW